MTRVEIQPGRGVVHIEWSPFLEASTVSIIYLLAKLELNCNQVPSKLGYVYMTIVEN